MTGTGGLAKPVSHEPSRLLGDADILRQLRAGDPLLVRRDQPNRHEPLAQLDLAVFENGADLDAKRASGTRRTCESPIAEMINPRRAAQRAKRTVLPADRREMVDRRLFVGERLII